MALFKNVMGNKCTHPETVKNGKDLNGRQRHKCAICGKTFTDESVVNPELRRKKRIVAQLLLLGYSSDQIKSSLSVKETEIDAWGKKYFPKLDDIKKSGKLIKVNYAYEYLSALDSGKRPKKRINKNKSLSHNPKKPGAKKSTRKKD